MTIINNLIEYRRSPIKKSPIKRSPIKRSPNNCIINLGEKVYPDKNINKSHIPKKILSKEKKKYIKNIDVNLDKINKSTGQINHSPGQINKSTRQINKSTRQINKSTRQINKSTRQINKSPRQINQSPRQINKSPSKLLNFNNSDNKSNMNDVKLIKKTPNFNNIKTKSIVKNKKIDNNLKSLQKKPYHKKKKSNINHDKKFKKITFTVNKNAYHKINTYYYPNLDKSSNIDHFSKLKKEDIYLCNIMSENININKIESDI